jgi:transcriptional regulator with XRE-family HTH domain
MSPPACALSPTPEERPASEFSRFIDGSRVPEEPIPTDRQAQAAAIGQRVTQFRKDRGLNLSQLAAKAGLSKSYVSSIEAGDAPRPSGETLYVIAEALGVTMSDLLGRRLLPSTTSTDAPPSLLEFAAENHVPEADVQMLASINFRGEQPRTKERWALIYSTIRQTEWMDRETE